jgi:hypothetical protein
VVFPTTVWPRDRRHGPRSVRAGSQPARDRRRRPRGTRVRSQIFRASLICWLCTSFAGLLLWQCCPASASKGHEFLSSLSQAPPGTKLLGPESVAIDHATGQVFVGDGAGYVDVYRGSGEYVTRFGEGVTEPAGVAVDETNGDVYVAEPVTAAVLVYEPDGKGGYRLLSRWLGQSTPDKRFGEVVGVAFDNSTSPSDASAGDLYVVESEGFETEGRGVVDVFKPAPNPIHPEEVEEGDGEEGQFVSRLGGPKLEEPNAVAVDSATGQVLVADSAKGEILTYSDAGAFEERLKGAGSPNGSFLGEEGEEFGNVTALAVDETSGEIYVAEAEHRAISQYSPEGHWLGSTTSTQGRALGEPHGVALTSSGDVYLADATLALVDVFGPNVVIPDAETDQVAKSEATRTSAVLRGTVNGEGTAVKYRFEWGSSEAYGHSTALVGAGSSEEAVAFTLEGLDAGTTYHYRIVAENENGAAVGQGQEFTTPPSVEALRTGPAIELESEDATLTGSLRPNGVEAHYYFQWGTTTFYGKTSPELPGTDAGSGEKAVRAQTQLSGLSPNTTYHYRLVAINSFGTTYGSDQQFTTIGPPRITNEPTAAISHEEATIHAKINPDQRSTVYHFEYGETTAYGSELPAGGQSIGSGSTPVTVSATLTKLKFGVTYHFRVVATNSAGTETGRDQHFTTVASAPVQTYATAVGAREATINAQIDPLGRDTTYYFQYGSDNCQETPAACTDSPTPPGEDIGSGETAVSKSVTLKELKPDTTYYYRVLASNSLGLSEATERTFTTKSEEPSQLPDGRAWEMVSPVEKHGAPIEGLTREGGVVLAAEDGDAITYVADGAITGGAEGNRSPEQQQVISTRTPEGWTSQDIATPTTTPQGDDPSRPPEYEAFTPDLSQALVDPFVIGELAEPRLSPEARQQTMYLRDTETGQYLPLVTEANVPPGTVFGGRIHFVAATPDLSHVIISSEVALTPPPSGPGLYEWSSGKLQFVGMLPDKEPDSAAELGYYNFAARAVSSDGTKVVWTNPEENSHRGHLYMTDTATGQTLQLDAAQGPPEPGNGSAQFQSATSDGSRVFFTDRQQLTDESTAEPGQAQTAGKPDLYECEIVEKHGELACELKDLTVDRNESEHAAVQGFLLGANNEGTSLYLVAQGLLASNENGNGEVAEPGQDNLYALHDDGAEWTKTFIARLSSEDKPDWEAELPADAAFLTAGSSPNGRFLAFMSAAPITGYDNVEANPEAKGARAEEVYLYDSAGASLTCVSCDPTGARPAGVFDTATSGEGLGLAVDRRLSWPGRWLAGNIPGWTSQSLTSALFQSRYLSNEGRLFFNSPDDLVPQAINGKEDVYEYEPAGVGTCQSTTGGCVALISGGTSERESAFVEATPSGNDVFFLTEAQLVPQDTDTAFDIYDARVCTQASPCLTPTNPAPAACDDTAACRPAQPAQQNPAEPAVTATVSGAGNTVSTPSLTRQGNGTKAIPRPPTLAQKLAKALEACRQQHPHSKKKRRACEAQAHRRYATHIAQKSSARHRSKAHREDVKR